MNKWVAAIPVTVFLIAVFMFAGKSLHRNSHVEPTAMVGRPVPALMLEPLEGGPPVNLRDASKGPILINVFASWCVPCRAEHPQLMAMQAQGVKIIGVAYRDKPADTAKFLTDLGDPYAFVLNDPQQLAGVEFGISGVPETFVVNSAGMITGKYRPIETERQMQAVLAMLAAAR